MHIDARLGPIEIHIPEAPSGRDEFTWTCNFGVWIISRRWLEYFEDLIDGEKIALGRVVVDDQVMTDWSTIHEANAPEIFSTQGWSKVCPICGYIYSMLRGKVFFTDAEVAGRPLIVTSSGIFVREDEALSRGLPVPTGAFKPSPVGLRPSP